MDDGTNQNKEPTRDGDYLDQAEVKETQNKAATDIVILCADEDQTEAEEFLKHLVNEIMLSDGSIITASIFGSETGSKSKALKDVMEESCLFLYMTDSFVKCDECIFFSDASILKTVKTNNWQVCPVYTKKKKDLDLPMFIDTLIGLNYYLRNKSDTYRTAIINVVEKWRKKKAEQLLDVQFDKLIEKKRNGKQFDGWTIKLDTKYFERKIKDNTPIARGRFGCVYKVKDESYVIKEIRYKDNDEIYWSAAGELLAARLKHFAIVPMIAMGTDSPTDGPIYFLFPYMENGSLAKKLKSDKDKMIQAKNEVQHKPTELELTKQTRRRILSQIASAMFFLHLKIPDYRNSYVHRDITTKNIVLDCKYNARLIDFGLAREYGSEEESLSITVSYSEGTPGYSNKGEDSDKQTKKVTTEKDLVSFGVVILEVLTSELAKEGNKYLSSYLKGSFDDFFKDHGETIKPVWVGEEYVKPYFELSLDCFNEQKTAEEVMKSTKNLADNNVWDDHQVGKEVKSCVNCMINLEGKEVSKILHHSERCARDLHVCVPCMRNSNLNPIYCPLCQEEVKSPIGKNWAAILVAGNDCRPEYLGNAKTYYNDMKNVEKAITSLHPQTIGIRKSNVYSISVEKPGKEMNLLCYIEEAFKTAADIEDLHTLLFYFSGHHFPENGFLLGKNDEFLPVERLSQLIQLVQENEKNEKFKRVIVLLDCCFGPKVEVDKNDLNLSVTCYQINSSRQDQKTNVLPDDGSPFTAFLLQCLRGKSSTELCRFADKNNGECKICEDVFSKMDGFIKMNDLFEFASNHIEKFNDNRSEKYAVTRWISQESDVRNMVFAYFIDTLVEYIFILDFPNIGSKPRSKKIPQLPMTMYEVKRILLEHIKDLGFPQISDTDTLVIEVKTGPKKTHFQELCTLEQIEDAWSSKKDLYVRLRKK